MDKVEDGTVTRHQRDTIAFVTSIMTQDDACQRIVPSDLRALVGAITSLRSDLARKEEALRTLSLIHDRNPSDAMADMAPVDYARHMLFEARQIALEALQPSSSEVQS